VINTTTPTFISLDEAAALGKGTRITFTPGCQGLYAEALKNICFVKGIPVIRALHPLMGVDKDTGVDRQARLFELTSQTSYPTMFYNEERPRNVWIEQLALAEKIGASNSPLLIPEDFEQRVKMFGLCAVVLGEDGLVWNMRVMNDGPLSRKYGYTKAASLVAPSKIANVIKLIDRYLQKQAAQGSKYLIGNKLTAADVYWATLSMCITVTPTEIMPLTEQNQNLLNLFATNSKVPVISEAMTSQIVEHQRYILTTYCETPAVLGGDPL
tara:strand:+ start:2570 stop:3376 length:807 start_codon:yes stop_codon:yes gene_type:complete